MPKNSEMCKCGHEYAYHVNPQTSVEDGCIFSYNCDCEKFTLQEKEPYMKVLVRNVIIFWYCKSHKDEQCQGDIQELWDSVTPICTKCNKLMTLKKDCLITN